ncbi:YycC family protein [Exiguobacterium sp. RIT452]|uniref:YycC family protein n=1 Tax=Exiguobacterium sp. RIT452 TaxID=2315552 RepID=UPI000E73278A|nr:YycC family protein [Exiguobacterium sp. RIT452]RJO99086.1 YycC family protein [Exiguobacterium sp. RIT452]
MKPLQLSAETAVELSKRLNVPLEQLMHMPRHILIQKLVELESEQSDAASKDDTPPSTD